MTTQEATSDEILRKHAQVASLVHVKDFPSDRPPQPVADLPPVSGPRSYQDLDGGVGKEVNFRPPRYASAELGPVGAVVTVAIGERRYSCVLHDVSQNGVAFEWDAPEQFEVGSVIATLTVSFDDHEAYRGAARVGSIRKTGNRQVVGASFLDTLMNIDDVLHLRDVKAWSGAGPGLALQNLPWRVAGHDRYKALVAELRLLLLDAEHQLGELEASLPWHVVHGDQDMPARDALIERVRREVVGEIQSIYNAIGSLPDPVTPAEYGALKEYTIRQLLDLFVQSPWLRRAKEKPLGYPGDYELMNGIYGVGRYGGFSGTTLFSKTLNLALTTAPAAVAVVERKNLISRHLNALLETRKPDGRPLRVLSLAAGPAQETYELLAKRESIPHPVEIVLFDQDKRALGFGYSRLKQLSASKWDGQVRVIYLHDTIKRLLRDPKIFSSFGPFDVIFSCGLFDYLPQATARTLTTNLFANIAPQGSLYIGNQTRRTTSRWAMEFLADWTLIYREHSEMLEFAHAAAPSAHIAIEEEPLGINPFVVLRRD